jgi:hypothetical protein
MLLCMLMNREVCRAPEREAVGLSFGDPAGFDRAPDLVKEALEEYLGDIRKRRLGCGV